MMRHNLWRQERRYHFAFIDWFYRGLLFAVVLLILVGMFVMIPTKSHAGNSQVATINAKLARWVKPTGKCANEQLSTLYGNGDGHVGKRVACGGVLDTTRPTIAHRTLPCGTKLTLTNPRNGRSVVATVTDRGPFTRASLDLGPAVTSALNLNTSSYVCVN